ncbi:MAG: hypothetical protein AAGF73_10750 [Actinomycetota bacterium]
MRNAVAVLSAAVICLFGGPFVAADGPGSSPQSGVEDGDAPTQEIDADVFTVEAGGGVIGAGVQLPGGDGEPSEPVDTAPRCERREATIGSIITSTAGGEVAGIDPGAQGSITFGTVTLLAYWERCDGGTWELVYVEPVDPLDLLPDAERAAREQLTVPSPNINPDPALGGFVNLGLWFAVDEPDPNPVVARAELSGAWAEVSGALVGIEVDPGSGDPLVVCDGLGVPIEALDPSLETAEQGPCGYTYTSSSPDDAPFQMTVTNVYELSWLTSDGRSGDLGEDRLSVTFDYDVDEIQTVGGP